MSQTEDQAAQADVLTQVSSRGISVVLPAYNEELVIAQTVSSCLRVLSVLAPDFEIIVVDDGSRDRTGQIADELARADPRIRVIHNSPNRGYGGALIAGFEAASKELTFFMDADGQFDIRDVGLLLQLRERGHRVVLGYREHRQDAFSRKLNAWGWNVLVRLLFGLQVRDVDCAFKLFDTKLVAACNIHSDGAMVNTELLAKLSYLGIPVTQVAVRHYPRQHGSATGANLRVIVHAFDELIRLRLRLHTFRPQQALEGDGEPALAYVTRERTFPSAGSTQTQNNTEEA